MADCSFIFSGIPYACLAAFVRRGRWGSFGGDAVDLLYKFVIETFDAMNLLQKNGHMTQLLILLYSAIDTMAWVGLSDGDVTRSDFKNWVNSYLIPETSLSCTADDLYGARCALVHTHTSESSSTSKSTARKIWYYGKGNSKEFLENQIGKRTDVVAVRVLDLMIAFQEGAYRCIEDLDAYPHKRTKALERASQWLGWVATDAQSLNTSNQEDIST